MYTTDQTIAVRAGQELDPAQLAALLREHMPELTGEPTLRQFENGKSNLTYLLQFPQRNLILRRPPGGTRPSSGHQMSREYKLMNALRPVFPHVPETFYYSEDGGPVGAEFYVMEWVEGAVLSGPRLPAEWQFDEAATRKLCLAFWDRLIELHQVDYKAVGLDTLGKPAGYIQRQIGGWCKRFENARTDDVQDCPEIRAWLADNMPATEIAHSVIHGDYRFDNCILDNDDPFNIVAVLDWEIGTVGDPLMDLGNSLAYWVEANDTVFKGFPVMQPSQAPGMLTRKEIFEYYRRRTGLEITWSQFQFHLIYGVFRNAAILQQIYYRYYHGESTDERFANLGELANAEQLACLELMNAAG